MLYPRAEPPLCQGTQRFTPKVGRHLRFRPTHWVSVEAWKNVAHAISVEIEVAFGHIRCSLQDEVPVVLLER